MSSSLNRDAVPEPAVLTSSWKETLRTLFVPFSTRIRKTDPTGVGVCVGAELIS